MISDEFKKQFSVEVQRSLLLSDEDKQYWLGNIDKFPQTLLDYFFKIISEKNRLVDRCIDRALQDDPAIVPELKEKVRKMKKDILSLEENEESRPEDVEKSLEEQLNNL